jgi:hypothetical protein
MIIINNIKLMVDLSDKTKELIFDKLHSIVNLEISDWCIISKDIKIKILHNFLSFILFNTFSFNNTLNIPIKSIKPKKLIMFCNMNKQKNINIFNKYNKEILAYTNKFREEYKNVKDRVYYTFNDLPKDNYNNILEGYNDIVYNTINENNSIIDIKNLYIRLINNNSNKLINDNNLSFTIKKENYNELSIKFNDNIIVNLLLNFNKNKITNNLPLFYKIKLTNKF